MIKEFPLLENTTYLNTAYVGLMSKSLIDHRRKSDEEYLLLGDRYKVKQEECLEECHQTIANFLGAVTKHAFFINNFSSGIRLILNCIPKDFRFLVLEEDYPSLTIAVEERGFQITSIPLTSKVEEAIEKAMALHPIDVLALSVVQYVSGLLIDFDALKRLKVKYPKLIIIGDGTQFIGGMPFHFESSPFDVIISSGYKWLLAGFGCGLIAVSESFLGRTNTSNKILYDKIFAGHFNFLGATSLNFAIKRLNDWNFSKLIQKKQDLSNKLRKELDRLELLDPKVKGRSKHSSIFNIPGDKKRYSLLIENEIRCKQRSNGIRISLHFYNTEEDIEHFVNCIENEGRL
ncbi:aminotransferase class V-fold PLP-dependent enzyme [Flavobacteriaceae bacterium]|nr:aminotransferase class V-fold PLP-dependent enzyme [Flavobacteriaceae bacterium]